MKLESTLKDHSGMLYTAPLMDVILMLVIFFLFGSNFVLRSGVEVKIPTSASVLPSAEDAHIITLLPGDSAEFYFDDERINLDLLPERLRDSKERSSEVILLGDETVDYGFVMEISRVVIASGCELSFATQQEAP